MSATAAPVDRLPAGEIEAVEAQIARDVIRRGLPAVPVIIGVAGVLAGINGALSAAAAVAMVVANLAIAAASLGWAARINLGLLMGVALFGYLVRIATLFLVVSLIKDAAWVNLTSLGLTLIVTHLGMLLWELRYVSASLAFPGLKPVVASATSPTAHATTKERIQ